MSSRRCSLRWWINNIYTRYNSTCDGEERRDTVPSAVGEAHRWAGVMEGGFDRKQDSPRKGGFEYTPGSSRFKKKETTFSTDRVIIKKNEMSRRDDSKTMIYRTVEMDNTGCVRYTRRSEITERDATHRTYVLLPVSVPIVCTQDKRTRN